MALMAFFALVAILLFACEADTADAGGSGTPSSPVSATVLTSTATPSDVRDRYAVFKITADKASSNYKLAIAPQGTVLNAADVNNTDNYGVHTYNLTAGGINVLMGFVYNAPILAALENNKPANATIVDDDAAMKAFINDTTAAGTYSVTGTAVGKTGDVAASMLKPGTSYTLYGLPAGGDITALRTFSTDPLNNDIPNRRGTVTADSQGRYPLVHVDNFSDAPLTMSSNNYNMFPIRLYVVGKINPPDLFFINGGPITIINQADVTSNPEYVNLIPGLLSDYESETGDTATPASVQWYWHSHYMIVKSIINNITISHTGVSNSPQKIVYVSWE